MERCKLDGLIYDLWCTHHVSVGMTQMQDLNVDRIKTNQDIDIGVQGQKTSMFTHMTYATTTSATAETQNIMTFRREGS